jgi:lipoate-protein ligase A
MDRDLEQDLPRATWRVLDTGMLDGATNMAVDEAILTAVVEGRSPPTIRFYGWSPPCVSIGYAQAMRSEVDLEACGKWGYTWVRRPTGGRAVLHIDELTYSVAARQDEPRVSGDIVTSYRRLSQGLIVGLQRLGCSVAEASEQNDDGREKSAACFDVPSHYEITVRGRKLVGSAQVRKRGGVLQHGALPLAGDVTRLVDVLALSGPRRASLRSKLAGRAIALDEALGWEVSREAVVDALQAGFAQALSLDLVRGPLTAYEQQVVARLVSQYQGKEWTFAR